jgi:RND family efflux transporter MFP subunit
MSMPVNQPRTVPPRPWLPVAIILMLLIAGGVYFYNATRPRPAAVEKRDIVGYVPLKGEILTPPSAYAEVRAPYTAQVDRVHTTLGAKVNKGELLVELANPSASETYEQARQNVKSAETAYANAKLQYDEAVRAAQKQLDAATAAQNAPSDTSAESNSSVQVTVTTDVSTAQQALEQARADRANGLAFYKQQLDAYRSAYLQARAGAKLNHIVAPLSGTVIALNAQPGQQVGNDNTPVATIVDLDALQVKAGMTPEQAGLVKPQLPVVLNFDTLPDRSFEGSVKRITTQADPNSSPGVVKGASYVALITFKNTDGLIKPPATTTAAVKIGEAKNALSVPKEAVRLDSSGKPVVYVLSEGKWQTVPVETGLSDGRYTQIKSGLTEGETIQVSPSLAQASTLTKP